MENFVKPKIGDIQEITEVVGFAVVKGFDEKGEPILITTEKQAEAELLSIAFKNQ